ncbi:MAG: HAMP domain-containing sensor histidine kinase [Lachnospiraceae bacterium]|nr:HAMP domain-containing sensor histidine kinase [Lachnospiraceae bacterium]
MNRSSILEKFSGLVTLAFVVSLCFFVLSNNISDFMIDKMSREKPAEKIVKELEEYIEENRLTTENRKNLIRWCMVKEVDIEVFVEDTRIFSSAFVPRSMDDNIRESEEDRDRAYRIRFEDTAADVVFYQFLQMRGRVRGTELMLSILLFFAIIVSGTRKELAYIHKINEEIHVLEGGDLTGEITIRGDDEISMLAESINDFRKTMQDQLRTIEQLEKNNRQMSAEIAHDLRTPLTSLIMYLDFARNEIEGREPAAEAYLTKAREKSVRLKNLLDQNYSYSTMQDYFMLEKQTVQAYEILSGFLGDVMTGLEREGFDVRSDTSYGHSSIKIHKDAAGRVFGNLMTNIIKYADKDKEVLLCCREREEHVEIRAVNRVRVFEGGKPESTGFGSRISRRLMEEMDGEYTAEESGGNYITTLRFRKA